MSAAAHGLAAARDLLTEVWLPDAADLTLTPLGAGHINDTLLVRQAGQPRYVLQRINQRVFADPALLAANLERVLAHLRDAPFSVPALLPTLDGGLFHRSAGDAWWRLWAYRNDTRTLNAPLAPAEVFAAGRAFGQFQKHMRNLPGPALESPIPGFLHLSHYLDAFDQTLRDAPARRLTGIDPGLIDAHRELAVALPPGSDCVHGDCKLDNLLFRADSAEVDCVLDLDTVMTGNLAWDFGDLVRSVMTLQAAANADAVATSIDPELFAAAADGFLDGRGDRPDPEALLLAPRYVSFMLGVRFLTDHLAGDVYFKVSAAGENLARAKAQFALLAAFEQQQHRLREALMKIVDQRV